MYAACRCDYGVRHALVVAHALHELADAGAGGLDPPHIGGEVRKVFPVCLVEVEEDLGLLQQLPPPGLLLGRAFDRRAGVISGVSRRPQQGGLVEHI